MDPDEEVVERLQETRTCIIQDNLGCAIRNLEQARELEECGYCRNQISRFAKQIKKLPKEKQLEKVELLIEIAAPAAYVAPRMRQIKAIAPRTIRGQIVGTGGRAVHSLGSGLKKTAKAVSQATKGAMSKLADKVRG